MIAVFNVFKFHNNAEVKAHFVLESPVGTEIRQGDVDPDGDSNVLQFSVANDTQVKATVTTDDNHSPESRMFDVTGVSSIGVVYVTAMTVNYSIGDFNVAISLAFDALD